MIVQLQDSNKVIKIEYKNNEYLLNLNNKKISFGKDPTLIKKMFEMVNYLDNYDARITLKIHDYEVTFGKNFLSVNNCEVRLSNFQYRYLYLILQNLCEEKIML